MRRLGPLLLALSMFHATAALCGEAEVLLEEQLRLLANQDTRSTVKVLMRLNRFHLLEHPEDIPAPVPTEAQRQRGCVPFVRNYLEDVYYNSNPRPREIRTDLRLFAAPGEYEPVTLAIKALESLSEVTVTCSDLTSHDGETIPARQVDIRWARQLARGVKAFVWMPGPEALEPVVPLDIPAGRTTLFWLTVHVPPTAAPGEYRGEVTVRPANKLPTVCPLQVVVLPVQLREDPRMQYGWYYSSGNLDAVRAELRDMRAHGFNTITIPEPGVRSVSADGQADIDFSVWETWRELLRQEGLTGIYQTGIGGITAALERAGVRELSPGFGAPFVAVLRRYKAWLDAHPDFRVVFTIYDEPRESLLNPWNRNFDDTVAYIQLCRQVPGLLVSVNPMGDSSGAKDYVPFAGLVDVLNTHAWPGSAKLIAEAKRLGKTLWVYNNGYSRLAWGFSLWKLGATGNWQWAYFGAGDPDPYSPIPTVGFENAGESHTGVGPVYRFPDRIIPTPRYEWVREGIDDYRYLYTLLCRMEEVSGPAAAGPRQEAEALLEEIRAAVPEYPATGLQTGAEAGGSGDPVRLMAYFDHFRWRIVLCLLGLEDAARGVAPDGADALRARYARYEFGTLPESAPAEAADTAQATLPPITRPTQLPPGAKLLFDFESDDVFAQLETDCISADDPFDPDIMPARRERDAATHGEYALHYVPTPRAGGLHLTNFDGNWTGFTVLKLDFYNPGHQPLSGALCITDARTPVPYPRAMGNYADRFDLESFVVPPGQFTLEVPLEGIATNGGRLLDLSQIRKLAVGLEGTAAEFWLDCIRLER